MSGFQFNSSGLDEAGDRDTRLISYRREQARQLFEQARLRGKLNRLWSKLTGKSSQMLSLAEVTASETIVGRYYRGTQVVPVHQICGSEGRSGDFDRRFNPLQKHIEYRWVRVALAALSGVTLPAVSLVQVGGTYFVQDGHHRISVAQALGQDYIDAEVIVWEVARNPVPGSNPDSTCGCQLALPLCSCAG